MGNSVQQNSTARITYNFYADDVLVDPTTLALNGLKPDGTTAIWTSDKTYAAGNIIKSATGIFYYDLAAADTAIKGTYTYIWKPVYSGNSTQDIEYLDVGNLIDNALCYTQQVQDYWKIGRADDVDIVQGLINRASRSILTWCRRDSFFTDTYTETYDTDEAGGSRQIMVKNRPIISVSSVTDDDMALASTDYKTYANAGIVKLDDITDFSQGLQHKVIVYSAGYGYRIEDLPEEIVQAAVQLAAYWYRSEHAEYSETFGTTSMVPNIGIPKSIKALLWPYRNFN